MMAKTIRKKNPAAIAAACAAKKTIDTQESTATKDAKALLRSILSDKENSTPSLPTSLGINNPLSEQEGEAQLKAVKFNFEQSGIAFNQTELLAKIFGLDDDATHYKREIKNPFDSPYFVAGTFFDLKKLEECIIDDHNVRDPAQRTKETLDDIYSEIAHGYQMQAIIVYKNNKGKYCILDGSRRYSCAILAGVGLDVEILDRKPSNKFLSWYVHSSDLKKAFSYYERGKLYAAIMKENKWAKQADLVKNRNYSKQEISFCLSIYNLPSIVMDSLPSKNLSFAKAKILRCLSNKLLDPALRMNAINHATNELSQHDFDSVEEANEFFISCISQFLKPNNKKKLQVFIENESLHVAVKRTKEGANICLKCFSDNFDYDEFEKELSLLFNRFS